ncbi:MAG: extracellular solute-binding protein [Treponema sp.]|nr:extracellular solute-binding protein [Treponema sp.]
MQKRRTRLALLVGLAMLIPAVAWSQIQVTLWDFMSGGDGVRWKQLISDFNSSQSEVKVNGTTLTWGDPFYTKVHTAVISGQTPDVMTYHISHFPAGLKAHDLRPITESELNSVGLSFKDFNPVLVEKSKEIGNAFGKAGDIYGIPLDTHTSILYYNKDLLKQAGLLASDGLPKGITGIDNFSAALQKIKDTTGALPLALSSSQDPATVWRLFYTLFAQQGGSFTPGGTFSLDQLDTIGAKSLQTMVDWTNKGFMPVAAAYPAAIAMFSSGKAAFMMNGDWEVTTMVDLKKSGKLPFDYGVMAFPQLFDNRSTWADSHEIVIPNNTRNPLSPAKLKAVLTFVAYVEKHSIIWAGSGHIPAYLPVLNSPAMAKLSPNNQFAVQAAKDVYFEPISTVFGVGTPALNYVDNFFFPALSGKMSVQDAISNFKSSIKSAMDQ